MIFPPWTIFIFLLQKFPFLEHHFYKFITIKIFKKYEKRN